MISDKETVKLPLRNLGVQFVESHYDSSDFGSPQRLGRRTIPININAADLIYEIAARVKGEGRPLYIYYGGRKIFGRPPHPVKIIGIGFHVAHKNLVLGDGDFFVRPNGELFTFGSFDPMEQHSVLKKVQSDTFERYLSHYLSWGDGEDEIKSAQSREMLDHITKGKER